MAYSLEDIKKIKDRNKTQSITTSTKYDLNKIKEIKERNAIKSQPVSPLKDMPSRLPQAGVFDMAKQFPTPKPTFGERIAGGILKGAETLERVTEPLQALSVQMDPTLGLMTKAQEYLDPSQKERRLELKQKYPKLTTTGKFASYIAPGIGASKLAGTGLKAGAKLLGKTLPKGLGTLAATEGLAGAGLGATEEAIKGKEGVYGGDIGKGALYGGLLGAGGTVALGGAGKLIGKTGIPQKIGKQLTEISQIGKTIDDIGVSPFKGISKDLTPRIPKDATKTQLLRQPITPFKTTARKLPSEIMKPQTTKPITEQKPFIPRQLQDIEIKPSTIKTFTSDKALHPFARHKMKKARINRQLNKFPEYVQRIEDPGAGRATIDKPHGVYTSPVGIESPHTDLGGDKFYWKTNPNAKILEVDATEEFFSNRGKYLGKETTSQGAGIVPARQFLGDEEVKRMMQTPLEELRTEAYNKYKNVDWNRYNDQHEIVEAIGAIETRNRGYDAIWAKDANAPEFNEFVAVTENAFSPVADIPKKKVSLPERKTTFEIESNGRKNKYNIDDFPDSETGKVFSKTVEETIPIEQVKYAKTDFGTDNTNDAVRETFESLEGLNVGRDDIVVNNAKKIRSKKTGAAYGMTDLERNLEFSLGKDSDLYKRVKQTTIEPLFKNKSNYTNEVSKRTNDLYDNVVKKLKIRPRTKESKAIQWFGEKKKPSGFEKIKDPDTGITFRKQLTTPYTLDDLKAEFPNKWQNIVEADKFFRKNYDELIDNVNSTRKVVYPTNPDKLVPKRKDYYRHFNDMSNEFKGMIDFFDTPANISPELAGISEFTTPKTKWQSFAQRRGQGKYTDDAILGYLDYIKPSSYSTHIDKSIPSFRKLTKDVIEGTMESKNANTFIEYLTDYTNDLAGKTNKLDRWISGILNRKILSAVNSLTSKVKGNVVLGNITSALAQPANIANAVGSIKNPRDWLNGMRTMLKTRDTMKNMSPFLKERQLDNLFDKFDQRIISRPKQFAKWMLSVGDELGSELIWNSAYNKANRLQIDNPIEYADRLTRKSIAGRGIGEVPLYQKSKFIKAIAPFQLEVANAWHVLKDLGREKDIGGIVMIMLANNMYNNVYEVLTGRRMLFDPIEAIVDSATREDAGAAEIAGRLGGEVLSSIPFGGEIAETASPLLGGEYGMKKLFGKSDPTRFGSGLLAIEGIKDPVTKLLPRWGGGQIKKTFEGAESLIKGGSYTKGDKFQFPVGGSLESSMKALTLGKYSTPEAKEYFDKNRSPLSESQTRILESKKDKKDYLERLDLKREKARERKKKVEERKKNRR